MKKIYFLLFSLFLFTSVNGQIINFPDANLKAKLLQSNSSNSIVQNSSGVNFRLDANNNGEIEVNEAMQVHGLWAEFSSISDVTGLSHFRNLRSLFLRANTLTFIDVSNLINLTTLDVSGNQLANIDVINLANIQNLVCNDNQLTSLSINNNSTLKVLVAGNNSLTSLFLKKGGVAFNHLSFGNNPNLEYVCIDESRIALVQSKLNEYGYTNCNVNSYCTFVPSGTYYVINGNNKFDSNINGCDSSDFSFPYLKLNITGGSSYGTLVANLSGNYTVPVSAGSYSITPVLENPTYFTVSPPSVYVSFPSNGSPYSQNFCIAPNGSHPDLEIILVPVVPARPGFDAKYKLIYKNKGNQTQSGAVTLQFTDAVLDLVSSNPAINNQTTNNLSWDFTNLQPFETREITITLNVNFPTETPAVNNGDILNYTASLTSAATDEMPNDNTFTFNQTVVNSFDPNDKTCLEGATISPSEVGKYVHYMIRFENNGTANAQNIVVKDMIDTNKFDINSLVPIKGSHSFVTNITSGNKVEFIFENINLPFDDANNDGYVAFKIRTQPTLVVGDVFSNSASIYFDYNFAIVTNTATTTIAALSNQDFNFATYFMLYPNPVNDILNIETKQTIEVSSINIYNQLGQLVVVVPNAQNVSKVDVSNLASGNYFIKINSDKGTSNTKFIKQ
ncbi:internalin-related protein [Flavobacterium limnosediminis JC2902]|uniref:Internalin-related protein n=1 Tax=Flavobacterium limnosediminis JC2902 TaxID=1341181 RepID=V6SF59_9FLAO|nr:T9SS type A sorting domain-containing protein [Flavobacterium limnosediminis]ESU25328.1 internalin-related protein [Flavobacterium limnosediminis JC2902]